MATLLFVFLIIISAIPNINSAELQNISFSTSVLQGRLFSVDFEMQKKGDIFLKFRGAETPCYRQSDDQWNCLAGIPADAKSGKEKFKIVSNRKSLFKGKVEICPVIFPKEPLTLTEEKKSLYSTEGREKEIKLIRSALKTESKEKLWKEDFSKPVEIVIESVYGEKRVLEGKPLKGFHRGVDLGAPEGTPIGSVNDGKVILAGAFAEEGNMVMIDHGQGIISAYLHMSQILVSKDQSLKKGEIVGKVGSTGISNTPHLHLGIYIHGIPIDPLYFINERR